MRWPRALSALPCLAGLAVAGCTQYHKDPFRPAPQGSMPDFSLTDVNPNSATSGQAVSRRQYMGKVSAWYFGHAT